MTSWGFQPDFDSALRLLCTLAAIFAIPGWLTLSLTPLWRRWPALNMWFVAIAISTAFIPVLFYTARFVAPWLALDRFGLTAGLALSGAVALWRWRKHGRAVFAFTGLEWLALLIVAATLFTRFWVIQDRPYPASPDSLHHVLITRLTVETGQLPTSLEPYYPNPLDMYHLGLHALAATAASVAAVEVHTALLWVSQVMNGLCGIGVYLLLDRRVSRFAAVIGLITAGLLSFQPAQLTGMGRATPIGSHNLLLVAIWMVEVALETYHTSRKVRTAAWPIGMAGLLLAGLFLIHFRVAGYTLPLLAIVATREAVAAYREKRLRALIASLAAIGATALVLVLPVLVAAIQFYLVRTGHTVGPDQEQLIELAERLYYTPSWELLNNFGLRNWLLALATVAAGVGLCKGRSLAQDTVLWLGALWLMGMAYVLRIPVLQYTNMTAIMLALYLPAGLLVGTAADIAADFWPARRRIMSAAILGVFLVGSVISGRGRAVEFIEYLNFVHAEDIPAMNWIAAHTPEDAYFAINTNYGYSEAISGTDAGYWIPYFTKRQITTSTMLFTLGDPDYSAGVARVSEAVVAIQARQATLADLRAFGVTHIYIGRAGNYAMPALDLAWLRAQPGAQVVYEANGVAVIDIRGAPAP